MFNLHRIYVAVSLSIILFATFQFLQIVQIVGLLSVLSLDEQFILQFSVKPWLFLFFGSIQCLKLMSIYNKSNQERMLAKKARMGLASHGYVSPSKAPIEKRDEIIHTARLRGQSRQLRMELGSTNYSAKKSKLFQVFEKRSLYKPGLRFYSYFAITVLTPVYQVIVNFGYLIGLLTPAMEWLWQYPSLFSILFLIDIILTGYLLSQTSSDMSDS